MADYTSIKSKRRPSTPGEILEDAFMQPRKITQDALAKATGMSRMHIIRILSGKTRITPDFAYRLGAVLGTSAQLWLNLQNAVDLYDAGQEQKRWKPKMVFQSLPC